MTKHEKSGVTDAAFGISGLDDILAGGLERDRLVHRAADGIGLGAATIGP